MKKIKTILILWLFLLFYANGADLNNTLGKKVFETYCWGCHHQTSMAFGPPFKTIAKKRSTEEIRAMIANPKEVSKIFGYKRNAMPAFKLKEKELQAIVDYILSFKDLNNTKAK